MGLLRRGVLFILSVLLLISLIGTAFAVSTYLTLAQPSKVEAQLAKSGFYTQYANNAIQQAEASAGNNIGGTNIDFNNPLIQQAAHAALSTRFLEQQGNQFINSNYAWLEGKQPQPSFTIDLSSARQDFANRVGQAVTGRLAQLPKCTTAQLLQLQAAGSSIDPFSVSCRPASLDPQTEGTDVTQEILQNSTFLNNPVISPQSITPNQSQPYYQKFSQAPLVYKLSLKAPYAWAGLTLVLILLIWLIARPKRRGLRRLAVVLLLAGILLVLNKVAADALFSQLQKQAFNPANNGQLQQSALAFFHSLEAQLVKIDLYFGVGYVVLSILLLVLVRRLRPQSVRTTPAPAYQPPERATLPPVPEPAPQPPSRQTAPTLPGTSEQPVKRKRPPRLLQ